MSPGKTETIISKKDTQKTFNAQPAFATTPKVFASGRRGAPSVQYRIWKTETENRPSRKFRYRSSSEIASSVPAGSPFADPAANGSGLFRGAPGPSPRDLAPACRASYI